MFEGDKLDVMYSAQYDENGDAGTTYLGMSMMRRQDELKAEHKASITEDCHIPGKWLDGTDCRILHDMEKVHHLCLNIFIETVITFFIRVHNKNKE